MADLKLKVTIEGGGDDAALVAVFLEGALRSRGVIAAITHDAGQFDHRPALRDDLSRRMPGALTALAGKNVSIKIRGGKPAEDKNAEKKCECGNVLTEKEQFYEICLHCATAI